MAPGVLRSGNGWDGELQAVSRNSKINDGDANGGGPAKETTACDAMVAKVKAINLFISIAI